MFRIIGFQDFEVGSVNEVMTSLVFPTQICTTCWLIFACWDDYAL